jgi:hypothetical protein
LTFLIIWFVKQRDNAKIQKQKIILIILSTFSALVSVDDLTPSWRWGLFILSHIRGLKNKK